MKEEKCKICRRNGVKLFLKGDRCISPKCPMVKRPYPPGPRGKKPPRALSEYGKELREKQKLRNWYGLRERQFKNYVRQVLDKRGKTEDAPTLLIRALEGRLDSIVFKLGFGSSRAKAKQLVSHGHFLVNDRSVNIPSCQLKKGDRITLKPNSRTKNNFQNLPTVLKKYQPPSWLSLDIEKMEGKVTGEPNFQEVSPPAEISSIFEFYSK